MRTGRQRELVWLPTGGHVGDAIMIMSLLAEITERGDVHVTYVVRRNAPVIAELAKAYPAIIVKPLPHPPVQAFITILALLKKRSTVIVPPARDVHPLIVKVVAWLCMLRGDDVIGFRDPTRDPTKWHPYNKFITYDRNERYIDNLRRAVSLASLPTREFGMSPRLNILTRLPENFPFEEKKYIVLHPFPHMSTMKTMPLRRWKELIKKLRHEFPSYGIVVTGAGADRAQAEELAANNDSTYLAIDRSLREVAGLVQHARLYVGIDTGPTHLAGVLAAPSIVLAQQNEPLWLPDYNPNAVLLWSREDCTCGTGEDCIVWENDHDYRRCVYGITDEAILETVRAII